MNFGAPNVRIGFLPVAVESGSIHLTREEEVMSHKDAPDYAGKHGTGLKPNPVITGAIKKRGIGNEITCAQAFQVVSELGLEPAVLGRDIDLARIKLVKCQLGLFGYGPQKSIVPAAEKVSDGLRDAIQSRLINGRLSCADAWAIADRMKLKKMDVSSAANAMHIQVKPCQLGAF